MKHWLLAMVLCLACVCPLLSKAVETSTIEFPIDKKTSYGATMVGDTLMITFDRPRKVTKSSLNKKLPSGFKVREIIETKNATTLKISTPPGTQISHKRLQDKVSISLTFDPQKSSEKVTPEKKASKEKEDKKKIQNLSLKIWEQRESLHLQWEFDGPPPPMAFFVKYLVEWIVFDGKFETKVEGAVPKAYGFLERDYHDEMNVFKLHLNDQLPYKIIENERGWHVVFGDEVRVRKDIIPPSLRPLVSYKLRTVGVPSTELVSGKVIEDRSRGSYMAVFPSNVRDLGVKIPAQYAEFEIAESRQGVVVIPRKRHIKVALAEKGVVISREGGLNLSAPSDRDKRIVADVEGDEFDFSRWDDLAPQDVLSRKSQLEQSLSMLEGDAQEKAYFDLANFLIAHGYEVEALGLLRLLGDEKPHVRHNPQYLALQSVAAYLVGDYQLGLQNISNINVLSTHGRLWKSGLMAAIDSEKALELFEGSEERFTTLREPLRSALGVKIIDVALDEKERELAEELLTQLSDPGPAFKDHVTLLSARLDELKGQTKAYELKLRGLAQSPNDKPHAQAELSLIMFDVENHKITLDEAIQRLENLRFTWRGDEVEFQTLVKLAELYRSKKNYKKSLSMMSMALRHFSPETEGYESVQEDMGQTFLSLFNKDGETLSPMTMIGLFQSFEHLLPHGDEGDKVVLNLSKKMLAYELTSKAIRVLERRLNQSTNPLLRQQLALAYLMDGQPEVVVVQADQLLKDKLSPSLREKAALLKVKALEDMGKYDEALRALQPLKTQQAERLKADIYQQKQDWAKLAQSLEGLVSKEKSPSPDLLFRWALAAYKAGNEARVHHIYKTHKSAIEKSPFKEEILLLASPDLSDNMSLDRLPLHLDQVDLFSPAILDANAA